MFENQGNVWNKNQSPAWKNCIGCAYDKREVSSVKQVNTHFTVTHGFGREL